MQWDSFITQFYLDYGGAILAIIMVVPALILRGVARYLEILSSRNLAHNSHEGNPFRAKYNRHPRLWTFIYNISNATSTILITTWFMVVFGFPPALVAFLALYWINGLLVPSLPRLANRNTGNHTEEKKDTKTG